MTSTTWWLGHIASVLLVTAFALGSGVLFGTTEAPGRRAMRQAVRSGEPSHTVDRANLGRPCDAGEISLKARTEMTVVPGALGSLSGLGLSGVRLRRRARPRPAATWIPLNCAESRAARVSRPSLGQAAGLACEPAGPPAC